MGRPIKDARRHLHVEGKTEEKKAEKKDETKKDERVLPSSPPEIDVDGVAALVHRAWMRKGSELRGAGGMNEWMRSYEELSEEQREASRLLVKTVLAAVATLLEQEAKKEETRP